MRGARGNSLPRRLCLTDPFHIDVHINCFGPKMVFLLPTFHHDHDLLYPLCPTIVEVRSPLFAEESSLPVGHPYPYQSPR